MKLIKKIRMWFWTKKKTIDFLTEFSAILDKRLDESVKVIKELDQDKIYFLCLEDCDQEDCILARSYLDKVSSRIRWTMPEIIVINQKLEDYTKEELKTILNKR